MPPQFTIHDDVVFRDGHTARAGCVVGVECVTRAGRCVHQRKIGWHYLVATADGDAVRVHEDDVALYACNPPRAGFK